MTAKKKRVYIVGFAPSWVETPWDDMEAERWGLNSLHRVASGRPFDRWFQLHDLNEHHREDHHHIQWLKQAPMPIYMFENHMKGWDIPNALAYPKKEILEHFGPYPYFTNSISWMLGMAIYLGFEEIGIYGVDMAQDAITNGEYSSQRPSCEWLIGWAQGKGIKVHVPDTADLMKTTHLYGAESHNEYIVKLESRINGLNQQKQAHEQQAQQHRDAALQLGGAIENAKWIVRTWVPPRIHVEPPEGLNPFTMEDNDGSV